MTRLADAVLAGVAPIVWGTTYIVTTRFLPDGYPVTDALLRALPAGLMLLLFVRQWPDRRWWGRIVVLGALNIAVFLICLFVSAYRLPGGVAATVAATQPLIAIFLARIILGKPLQVWSIASAIVGIGGVALLVLTPKTTLDPIGLGAGLVGAASMAAGNVLSGKWKSPDVSLTAFTSWQLIAGGLLLIPVAFWTEPPLPHLTSANIAGFIWLSVVGAALTYLLWFRGIVRLGPSVVSPLLFLSPTTAVILGWAALGQRLNPLQVSGAVIVLASVWASQIRSAPKYKAL